MNRSSFVLLVALACSVLAVPGHADLRDGAFRNLPAFREGHLVVKYRPALGAQERAESRERHGCDHAREFPDFGLEHHRLRAGLSVEQAIVEYEADPDVEYAEPDYVLHALTTPNDPSYANLWGLAQIRAPAAWDGTTGSQDMVVAVIDSGIDYTHPDLKPNLWTNAAELNGRPGVDDDGNGVVDDVYGLNAVANSGNPLDDDDHGTHVAGVIGAVGNNGVGVTGVNWNVRVMACKFLDYQGSGSTSDAIQCLQYVRTMKDRGVNIVATNNSWGGGGYSQALYDAISAQKDILFVVAAGNSSTDNDATGDYPSGYDLPNVLSVAATDRSDSLSSFSNYGRRTVHVGAPGSRILSTVRVSSGSYLEKSGTSMASPFVAGLAALIKAQNPTLSWIGVKNRILAGAVPAAGLTEKTLIGARVDAANSLTCSNRLVLAPVKAPTGAPAGTPVTVSALSIRCEAPEGPVTAALSTGQVLELRDDGVSPDVTAGDGIFSRSWTPAETASVVSVSNGMTTASTVSPLTISQDSLVDAGVGSAYDESLGGTGGVPPYTWAIASGALPPGLSLDAGSIRGVPSSEGTFSFTVQLTDSTGTSVTTPYSLLVREAGAASSGTVAQGGGGGGGGGGCFLSLPAGDGQTRGLALLGLAGLSSVLALRRLSASRRRASA
ncbi:MAG: S8 family serine peptidase [Deltaproteobacteria bacterium]|nr:S8 family serine peptidase [Deltaproteobacteria bacterium]